MALGEHVFLYCERGTSEAFLAEPINAASNVAFLVAALAGLQLLAASSHARSEAPTIICLISSCSLIGLGSLAFHLYATGATELADVLPICLFMLVYLGFAMNRFLGVPVGWTVLLVIGFTSLMAADRAGQMLGRRDRHPRRRYARRKALPERQPVLSAGARRADRGRAAA